MEGSIQYTSRNAVHILKKKVFTKNTEFKHRRGKKCHMQTHAPFFEYLLPFQSNLPKNLIIDETATDNWLWIAVMTVRPV